MANRSSTDAFELGRATLAAAGVKLERADGRYRVRTRSGNAEAVADDLLTAIELGAVIARHATLAKLQKQPQRNRRANPKTADSPSPR